MPRAVLLLALLLLAPWPSLAQEDDPAELAGALWGKTAAGLEERLGGRLSPLPGRFDFGPFYAEQQLEGVRIGGLAFRAYLQLDRDTARLSQILLERRRAGATPDALRRVLDALEGLYGPPDAERTGGRPGLPVSAEFVWNEPGARLTLHLFDFRTTAVFGEDPNRDRDPLSSFYRRMRNNPRLIPTRLTIRLEPPAPRADP